MERYKLIRKIALIYIFAGAIFTFLNDLLVIYATTSGFYLSSNIKSPVFTLGFYESLLVDLLLFLSVYGIAKNKRWGWAIIMGISLMKVIAIIYYDGKIVVLLIWAITLIISLYGASLWNKVNKK